MGLGKMFSDPNMLAKLAGNPRTSKYLADPGFVQKVCHNQSLLPLEPVLMLFPHSSASAFAAESSHGRFVSIQLSRYSRDLSLTSNFQGPARSQDD